MKDSFIQTVSYKTIHSLSQFKGIIGIIVTKGWELY
jgi:hypothetical protein